MIARRVDGMRITVKLCQTSRERWCAVGASGPVERLEVGPVAGEMPGHIELPLGQDMNAEVSGSYEGVMSF